MQTSIGAGVVTYEGTDPAEIHSATQALGASIETKLVPKFATTAARTTGFGTPIEGQLAYINGYGMSEYDGAAWVPLGTPRIITTKTYSATTVTASSSTGVNVTGIDGQTFTLQRARMCTVRITGLIVNGDTVGQMWRVIASVDSTSFHDISDNVTVSGTGGRTKQPAAVGIPIALAAGSHTIHYQLAMPFGSGTVTLIQTSLSIVDEGPAL